MNNRCIQQTNASAEFPSLVGDRTSGNGTDTGEDMPMDGCGRKFGEVRVFLMQAKYMHRHVY